MQAIQQTLEVHPEIQASINIRVAADYRLKAAKGGSLPQVDLPGGYGREDRLTICRSQHQRAHRILETVQLRRAHFARQRKCTV
jgi:hypothetical protein